ncbi:MAG: hypothetical protein ACFE7R_06650 [Candidatus Hodarchaeota archaeon]
MTAGHKAEAYSEFSNRFDVSIPFTSSQIHSLDNDEPVSLAPEQLKNIVNQLAVNGPVEFLEKYTPSISPIRMSLYVINEATWKLMYRKPWDKEKMLAMSTMPYCYWDQGKESTQNPKAVHRWELGDTRIDFQKNPPSFHLMGKGGDFSGFVERSQLTMRKFGMIESRNLIPNYEFTDLYIHALLEYAQIEIHPSPRDDLDYDFSASAKTFYEDGFLLKLSGERVSLTVGKKKGAMLHGNVLLYIAADINDESDLAKGPLVDTWMSALGNIIH